ncbi:MAG: ABC transporter permease [Humidesulfovibrio sp.]|uniref:ABC transporter permease n=1 Tax=Humidesulfovibrio sp. TaxID=2910988 RepID=UPI0027F0225E|nr:ABC transporter permease [Humidesulfovibrio sp.]MDQ7834787.1 ABC transporter permease [Humidesulfovibrio sp.]
MTGRRAEQRTGLAPLLRQLSHLRHMALAAIWAYKVRSFFVILGVGFGVASLTLIVTAVDGTERKAVEIVDWFGPDAALVFGGNIKKQAVGARTNTLTQDDIRGIRQSLPGAYLVVPMRAKPDVPLKYQDSSAPGTLVIGATEGYAGAWNWPLVEGRDLSEEDVRLGARVAILGDKPARELFGEGSPIGRTFMVDKFQVQVIGRLKYRGASGGGGDIDDRIIIPITTLTARFNMDRRYYRAMRIKFLEPERMAAHVENLRSYLRMSHGLTAGQDDDFSIITADEVLKFLSAFKGGLMAFLGVTAASAMTVGGFVLANLFSISVSERSREIGLKKAVGATNNAILLQFLMEAAMLTALGGLVGLGLGLGLGQLLTRLGMLQILFSWKVFFLSLASAVGIGVVFGLKPARQAAQLDPIAALRGGG